ncbi:MAG: phosphate signaling complex protein PhoU [Actinomycetota bacterium]|nr:phosphate signaling complex protein PhoU [Actinomycetota bacterium]
MQETRKHFHEELGALELELLAMGELAGSMVQRAVEAIVQQDATIAEAVIEGDDEVDDLYLKIDAATLQLLALQSPVAADLRLVSAILHSNLHLERIGDQAVNVAKLFLATKDEPGSEPMRQQIDEMGTIVISMLRTALEGFARRDLELVMKVPEMDDPVDRLNRATHLEALKLADDARRLDWGMHMNMAARALERVGDNTVDIAEQVRFLLTGDFQEFTDASHPVNIE